MPQVWGGVIALMVFLGVWLFTLLDFRSKLLRARQGRLPYPPGATPLRYSWSLVGTAIASAAVSFLLCAASVGLLVFCLNWSVSQRLIGGMLARFWGAIFACVVCYLLGLVWTPIVEKKVGARHSIHHRYLWMAVDFIALFTQLFAGGVTAVVRVLLGILGLLCGAARIDSAPYPAWLEASVSTDALVLSYRAAIAVVHQHSNPVMLAFVQLLTAGATQRRAASNARVETPTSYVAQSGVDLLDSGSAKLRISHKWRKAAFLLLNPAVRDAAKALVDEAITNPQRRALEMPDRIATIKKSSTKFPPFKGSPTPSERAEAAGAPSSGDPDKGGRSAAPGGAYPAVDGVSAAADAPIDGAPASEPPADRRPSTGTQEKAYLDGQRKRLQSALGLNTPSASSAPAPTIQNLDAPTPAIQNLDAPPASTVADAPAAANEPPAAPEPAAPKSPPRTPSDGAKKASLRKKAQESSPKASSPKAAAPKPPAAAADDLDDEFGAPAYDQNNYTPAPAKPAPKVIVATSDVEPELLNNAPSAAPQFTPSRLLGEMAEAEAEATAKAEMAANVQSRVERARADAEAARSRMANTEAKLEAPPTPLATPPGAAAAPAGAASRPSMGSEDEELGI